MRLLSSYEHNVDAKGRVFIPARWREQLGDTVIITRSILGDREDRCLFGMPIPTWDELMERFSKAAISDKLAQRAMVLMLANAIECEPDKQGRILIPAPLRTYAGIEREAVLNGVFNRFEVRSPAMWQRLQDEELSDDMFEHLMELGI